VVGHLVGAPVVVSPGWALTAGVLTLLLAPTVSAYEPGLGAGAYVVAAVGAVLLFGSAFFHELAHAVVARRRGVQVREIAVTLLGGHTELATPAPTPATSAVVAVAGPVVNIVLGGLCWLLWSVLPAGELLTWFAAAAALSNAFIGIFNLVPGLPLDGGRVLEALVWRWTGRQSAGTVVAGWVGRVVAVGVVAWALLVPVLAGTSPDLVGVAWGALIGAFVWSGASQAIAGARSEQALEGISVEGLMTPAVAVPSGAGLGAQPADVDVVLVGPDGTPVAYVDREAAATVPAERRAATPVAAVAVPLPADVTVPALLTGRVAVQAVGRAARYSPVMVVVDAEGRVVGLLRAQDVIAAVRGAQARGRR
jgi:Zn-dependent protease